MAIEACLPPCGQIINERINYNVIPWAVVTRNVQLRCPFRYASRPAGERLRLGLRPRAPGASLPSPPPFGPFLTPRGPLSRRPARTLRALARLDCMHDSPRYMPVTGYLRGSITAQRTFKKSRFKGSATACHETTVFTPVQPASASESHNLIPRKKSLNKVHTGS